MREITFSKANEQHLKDCRDVLCRSTLGDRYFSSQGSAEEAILEGIRQENLYVAFIGEECVGFTYIIPKGAFHSFPYLHIIAKNIGIRGSARLCWIILRTLHVKWQTNYSLLSRIIIPTQSGSMKETAISKLGKFQTCTAPESQNT